MNLQNINLSEQISFVFDLIWLLDTEVQKKSYWKSILLTNDNNNWCFSILLLHDGNDTFYTIDFNNAKYTIIEYSAKDNPIKKYAFYYNELDKAIEKILELLDKDYNLLK